eukprot:scaffold8_cov249-Pinguiococcus_pyrenoidosus.AAC.17
MSWRQSLSSEQFSEQMYKWLEEGGSRVCFVIGGAEGYVSSRRPELLAWVAAGLSKAMFWQAAGCIAGTGIAKS